MANTTSGRPAILRAATGRLGSAILALMIAVSAAGAGEPAAPHPGKHDKCPVCGMFVYRFPDFVASIRYPGGATVFFDGAKDMFKYLFDLSRYAPGRTVDHATAITVTEYYDMQPIDARSAVFVVGSDVLGPMGNELIPFRSRADADLFTRDHQGRMVLTFGQVTPAVIRQLD